MGITIHFGGRLKGEAARDELIARLLDIARSNGWTSEYVDEPEAALNRVHGEESWEYTGPACGAALYPHENCDPINFAIGRDLWCQDYVKTQFAPIDIHQSIVSLLRKIEPFFEIFEVEDEGEYWDTGDEKRLAWNLSSTQRMIDRLIARHRGRGPVRAPGVRMSRYRIIDMVGEQG